MWIIYRGASGYVYPTTREKELLTSPYYLIKFICDTTKKTAYCTASDVSAYPNRNQKFLITETSTPVSANGQVSLDYRGRSWKYFVYESATVPIIETGLTEVENGEVKVINGSATTPQRYTGYTDTSEQT